jgi:lipopolysaccharide transport system ATP-binding protein
MIVVEGLGKRYQVGTQRSVGRTFCEAASEAATTLLRRKREARPSKDFWALRDVSFEVERGEVLGVIGGNGAGKSTLLKLLSRITKPTEGHARLRGRVGSLLEVGTGFHPELSGRENIYLNGAVLGMRKAEIASCFDAIVDFSGVERFLDTPVKRYSSGMYTRLAFAVAAHLEPEILIVDEVLAVGDVAFQQKCLGKMKEVAGEGRTVLFVSHNMGAVQSLTDRCLYLHEGRAVGCGRTSEVLQQYRNERLQLVEGGRYNVEPFRRGGTRDDRLTIRSIRVENGSANEASILSFGGEIRIEVEIDASEVMPNSILTMLLKDANGMHVCTVFSPDAGCVFNLRQGVNRVTVDIGELKLAPGRYFCDLGVSRTIYGRAADVIVDFPLLTIRCDDRDLLWPDRPWGAVGVTEVRWNHAA